jgi:predicted solute-binding protein
MSLPTLPSGARIGSVPYLNALPLIAAIPVDVELATPSQLALRYESGALDAALVPIYQVLQYSSPLVGDGMCIGSHGEVFSVFLAYQGPLSEVRRVHMDPASCTSNALFRCLCAEYLHLAPEFRTDQPAPKDARILIGDPAIDFRLPPPEGWNFLDLGKIWTDHTGLPFVYAAWALQKKHAHELAKFLRSAKDAGMENRAELAAKSPRPDFAKKYLTDYIRYNLNEPEKQGLSLFAKLLYKYGLSPVSSQPIFV